MMIVPELETVVILVPRTGSGSLRRAIEKRYPKSMLLYRHMEADGVPAGYDRWRRVGVVRDPVERLWSLYKFLKTFGGPHDSAYISSMRNSVDMPFDKWLVENQTVFTSPYDSAGFGRYWPHYSVRHPLPENRKSQFLYLRPDIGTHVHQYTNLDLFLKFLDVAAERHNKTSDSRPPVLSEEAKNHVNRFFKWDLEVARG